MRWFSWWLQFGHKKALSGFFGGGLSCHSATHHHPARPKTLNFLSALTAATLGGSVKLFQFPPFGYFSSFETNQLQVDSDFHSALLHKASTVRISLFLLRAMFDQHDLICYQSY